MVTDGILCAVQGIIDRLETSDGRNARKAIQDMLSDFDEENWNNLNDSGTVNEWLQQYIRKHFYEREEIKIIKQIEQ